MINKDEKFLEKIIGWAELIGINLDRNLEQM